MSDLLPVTQADRDAVQAFHRMMAKRIMSDITSERPKLGEDEGDAGTLVQAFARHRIAHSPSRGGEVEKLREALWKPADAETRRLGWSYDVADIEAVRDEAEKVCGYDAALEVYHEVMRIAERRLANAALASPPPVEGLTSGEGWHLVPVEPTEAMIEAFCQAHCDFFGGAGWWKTGLLADTLPKARQAATLAYRAALAASPATHAGSVREVVAKIVNPNAFISRESLYDYCISQGDTEDEATRIADDTHKPDCDKALTKADAILAALHPVDSRAQGDATNAQAGGEEGE